ncbi:unnamed protein product [Arabis nemorensis]|uniref:Uncharacterized protein n=1 Tax=Arabis nemorensis TaxID=586526 RepID=A0A565CBP0_9BRAS|nr:unnamed protein product [Arabis nemorensis]
MNPCVSFAQPCLLLDTLSEDILCETPFFELHLFKNYISLRFTYLSMRLKLPRYEALRLHVSHLLLRYEGNTGKLLPISVRYIAPQVLFSRAEMDKELKEFVGNHRYCQPLNCFSLMETSRFIVDIKLLSFGIFPFFDVFCTNLVVYFKVPIHHLSYVVLDTHCDVYSFMECLVLSKSLFEGWKMLELGGIHNKIPPAHSLATYLLAATT